MKKSFKIGLVAAMIALASIVTVFGAELPVNVKVSGEKSIDLYFNEIKGKISIYLIDGDGQIFHSKRLKDLKSSLRFSNNTHDKRSFSSMRPVASLHCQYDLESINVY